MNLEQYINALKWHDWSFEFSDDHSVVQRASKVQQEINAAQPALDPEFKLWNQYAPHDFKRGIK
jgi:hypothetical protein